MQPSGNETPETRRIDWLGIFRILLVQVLVLLALSVAFIRYLDWSSEQALEEFSRAIKSPEPVTDAAGNAGAGRQRQDALRAKDLRAERKRHYSVTVCTTLLTGRALATGSFMSLTSASSYSGKRLQRRLGLHLHDLVAAGLQPAQQASAALRRCASGNRASG